MVFSFPSVIEVLSSDCSALIPDMVFIYGQVIFLPPAPLHPHIYSNGHICLGKWFGDLYFVSVSDAMYSIVQLITEVGAMIRKRPFFHCMIAHPNNHLYQLFLVAFLVCLRTISKA